jgi:hypothetical protein
MVAWENSRRPEQAQACRLAGDFAAGGEDCPQAGEGRGKPLRPEPAHVDLEARDGARGQEAGGEVLRHVAAWVSDLGEDDVFERVDQPDLVDAGGAGAGQLLADVEPRAFAQLATCGRRATYLIMLNTQCGTRSGADARCP